MKQEKKTIDEKIFAEQCRRNELEERISAIPQEIGVCEQKVLHSETESDIAATFEELEGLRRELREKRLLARRAQIRRLTLTVEKLKAEIAEKRAVWQTEFDKLPPLHEAVELARQALETHENLVKRLESQLGNVERSLISHEIELSQIMLQPVPLD